MSNDKPYVLTEIWKGNSSWAALSRDERARYFDEKINPFLGQMLQSGAKILACAFNNNSGAERIDYDYMAVWQLPNKQASDQLEKGAKERGFLDYFEQVNFSGDMINPPDLNQLMIDS